jgi:hypothetical protein
MWHPRPVVLSILYLMLRRLLGVLPGSRSGDAAKDMEIAVLRHQVQVLRRQVGRPSLRPLDRMFLAAAAHLLPRDRWTSFMITPQTLLRWHRELVRRKWTPPEHQHRRSPSGWRPTACAYPTSLRTRAFSSQRPCRV